MFNRRRIINSDTSTFISASPSNGEILPSGGVSTIEISSDQSWTITQISGTVGYITVSPETGVAGITNVDFSTVNENSTGSDLIFTYRATIDGTTDSVEITITQTT